MRIPAILLAVISLSPASIVLGQSNSDYDRALAAGYRAQFTCSGLFNGNKNIFDIQRDELSGIYDRVAPIVKQLEAVTDFTDKHVRVDYGGPQPRYSVWNPNTGCTAMPIGWKAPMEGGGTKIERPKIDRIAAGTLDSQKWPMGDVIYPFIAKPKSGRSDTNDLGQRIGLVADKAFDGVTYGNGKTSAILIVYKGKVIREKYKKSHDKHTAQRTWSVAKSIGGTFAGYVAHKNGLDVNASLNLWANKDDPRNTITIDDTLRMASGLYSDTAGNRTDPIYMGGSSASERTTSWPSQYEPKAKFRYSNNDILLASMAVRKAAPDIHPHHLFDKLGMTRTYAETDWQGNYLLSSQVWTTARDLARLGLLYMHDGVWPYGEKGPERLLPENWQQYVSAASGPQPTRDLGYGATFWLLNNSDGIPKDAISANGNRGQYLVIIPSLDLIIVRRGYDTREKRFNIQSFTRAIISQL